MLPVEMPCPEVGEVKMAWFFMPALGTERREGALILFRLHSTATGITDYHSLVGQATVIAKGTIDEASTVTRGGASSRQGGNRGCHGSCKSRLYGAVGGRS